MPQKQTDLDRFYGKIERLNNGCWIWTGAVIQSGFGVFRYKDKQTGKYYTVPAHKWLWMATYAAYPFRLTNLCGLQRCVNIDHWHDRPAQRVRYKDVPGPGRGRPGQPSKKRKAANGHQNGQNGQNGHTGPSERIYYLGACQKCGGSMALERDSDGWFRTCLACGGTQYPDDGRIVDTERRYLPRLAQAHRPGTATWEGR